MLRSFSLLVHINRVQSNRSGDESESPNPVYDPATGNGDGSGRTPFPGNLIPSGRIAPAALKLEAITPLPNVAGALANDYYATGPYSVNRNTTDADSAAGLPLVTGLAGSTAAQPRPMDGAVPTARRSQAK